MESRVPCLASLVTTHLIFHVKNFHQIATALKVVRHALGTPPRLTCRRAPRGLGELALLRCRAAPAPARPGLPSCPAPAQPPRKSRPLECADSKVRGWSSSFKHDVEAWLPRANILVRWKTDESFVPLGKAPVLLITQLQPWLRLRGTWTEISLGKSTAQLFPSPGQVLARGPHRPPIRRG